MRDSPTIMFAGGGTGGHLSPGLAIAEELAERAPHIVRLFACSTRSIDARMLTDAGESFMPLDAHPFSIRPRGAMRFLRGWRAAGRKVDSLLNNHNVGVVLALGGFVAAPVAAKASQHGVSVVLLNLDATPGKANRLAARWATEIVSSCDTPGFPKFTQRRVAMPLRRSAIASQPAERCRESLRLNPNRSTLLITGASQGSESLNTLIRTIVHKRPEWLRDWQIYHLTGPERESDCAAFYRSHGIKATVDSFQNQMGLAWGAADLAFSRAGANSVAESAINAVPAVFFPYPFHRDNHQFENAEPLVRIGGAVIATDEIKPEVNLDRHGELLRQVLTDRSLLDRMHKQLLTNRPQNGATELTSALLTYLGD